MTRNHSALPYNARMVGLDLVARAEKQVEPAEDALFALRQRVLKVKHEATLATDRVRHERQMLSYSGDAERSMAKGEEGKTAAERRRQEALAALNAAYERARDEREAKHRALEAEERELEIALEDARARARALRDAQLSSYGLAPWDVLAMRALKAWGEPSGLMETTDTGGGPLMLRGAEAAALVQARLGVSRSTYFERYRPLLMAYHVCPWRAVSLPDGGRGIYPGATLRFRRDEVEAMLRFLLVEVC